MMLCLQACRILSVLFHVFEKSLFGRTIYKMKVSFHRVPKGIQDSTKVNRKLSQKIQNFENTMDNVVC